MPNRNGGRTHADSRKCPPERERDRCELVRNATEQDAKADDREPASVDPGALLLLSSRSWPGLAVPSLIVRLHSATTRSRLAVSSHTATGGLEGLFLRGRGALTPSRHGDVWAGGPDGSTLIA